MALRFTRSFINTSRPGAYFETLVQSQPVGVASSGIIAIIGEASGGEQYKNESVKDNYFTPDQFDRVKRKYISGPIVDAFNALSSPSSDADITGSANRIYILKTNSGSKASAQVANSYGELSDKNFGFDGNKYFYQVTQVEDELAPAIEGDSISALADSLPEISEITTDTLANTAASGYIDITAKASPSNLLYRFWMDTTGADAAPAAAGRTLVRVDISSDVSANDVASTLASVINAQTGVSASAVANLVTVENDNDGDVADISLSNLVNAWAVSVSQQGDDVDASSLLGVQFAVRLNGGVSTVIDVFNGAESTYDSAAEIAALIDAALPAGMSCEVGAALDNIKISIDADSLANSKAWGKSFELIEVNSGDLAALGLNAGLVKSSVEPQIQLDIKRTDVALNESFLVRAEVAMSVGYQGTSASLTISGNTLSTTVVGGAGANLSIDISQYTTIKDLADYINSQTGYSAQAESGSQQLPTSALDKVTAIGICASSTAKAGRIKKALHNFTQAVSNSSALDFEADATGGLPAEMSSVSYLSGGAKGSSTSSDVVSAFNQLEGIDINLIVPLFSRNASEDIAEGLTESNSTYSISAINAALKNHVLKMSTAKLKKHRLGLASFWGTYAEAKAEANILANARLTLCMQKSSQVNSQGEVQSYLPWHSAVVAAGMQAAGFYKAIVNKFANVISFQDPSGFDSGSPGDIEDALQAGILFMEKDIQGSKWVSDQTTYGLDTNFVYNSLQAMYASDLVSLDLAASYQRAFVGKSLADITPADALAFLDSKMFNYKQQKLIAASDGAESGYRNAKVAINAPAMDVQCEIFLASALYFIGISLNISQVTGNAEF